MCVLPFLIADKKAYAQQGKSLFEMVPTDFVSGMNPIQFGEIICTQKGSILITTSMGLAEMDGMQLQLLTNNGMLTDEKGKKMYLGKNSNIFKDQYEFVAGIKLICEGPDGILYVVSNNNNFGCIFYTMGLGVGFAPFNFPINKTHTDIRKIWIDQQGKLFIATNTDTIYTVTNATKFYKINTEDKSIPAFMPGLDKDSNFVVTIGARPVEKFSLGKDIIPNAFFNDPEDDRILLIGTNKGLYAYDKQTGQSVNYVKPEKEGKLTITQILANNFGSSIWFSTLEKGMGRFNIFTKSVQYFPYHKKDTGANITYPINTFSVKSANDFFVAIADSLPAVFNTETGDYVFINDPLFSETENKTTDIKMDAAGNLVITKGGGLYWSRTYLKTNSRAFNTDSALYGPYLIDITLNGTGYNEAKGLYGRYESLKEINLKYNENKIGVFYSCRGISADSLVFAWKLDNYNDDWVVTPSSILEGKMNMIFLENLQPGNYLLHIKARNGSDKWLPKEAQLAIIISPPFWQTWWFWLTVIAGISLIIFTIVKWRVNAVRKQERLKAKHEKDLLELEAKALRAQMNPHFIFNCMNSIKSLIQQKEEDKAVNYLTTFSKLLRTVFQNSDKREITLFDEIETCKLYTQLESMRFGKKFTYQFIVDQTIDLKSIQVPALILQPYIENAIWHGIVPKEDDGNVTVMVKKMNNHVQCIIDDNGIGREMSKQNKFKGEPSTHQSKGVHLTQTRLDLDNALNERNAIVEITDKKDLAGNATGTTVTLTFTEY